MSKHSHQNIIRLLGIESLPLSDREKILEQAAALVEDRVLTRIIESLPDDAAREAFGNAAEQEDEEAIEALFKTHAIPYESFVQDELSAVKEELASLDTSAID